MNPISRLLSRGASPFKEQSYVLRLSFPAIFENLMATLMQLCNMAMVGSLGPLATATVAVNASPTWVLNSLVMAVGVGATALTARFTGAKDSEKAESALGQTFLLGLVMGALLTFLSLFLAPMLPKWLHADPALYKDATDYMRILCLGFLPYYMGLSLAAALRGAGDMRTPMAASGAASLLNILGGFLLVFPSRNISFLGASIPMWGAGLGVRGAAVSTAVTTALSGVWLLLHVLNKSSRLRLRISGLRPDFSLIGRLLKIGIPSALERLSISLGQVAYIGMVASLGTAQLAAHHLVVTIESLSYMPGYGFGAAAATLVGQAIGAGEPENARRQAKLCIRLCLITMTITGVLLYIPAHWWMHLFTTDAAVLMIGASILRICALEQPATALHIVSSGALRGAGDTRVPFVIALISMWGVRLTLAWLFLNPLHMGIQGAWWAMVADLWFRGLVTYFRLRKGKWLQAHV